MSLKICAFNSNELNDLELMADGLNVFVHWDLSSMFGDLILSRDLASHSELGELDQIATLFELNLEPLFEMSNYWDKESEAEHLSWHTTEADKAKQLAIIQASNESLIGNMDLVNSTVCALEAKALESEYLKYDLKNITPDFFDNGNYFSLKKSRYQDRLIDDLATIKAFIEFAKSLDADTVYFKFKTEVK